MNPILNRQNDTQNLEELYKLCQNPHSARNMLNQIIGSNPLLNIMANKGDFKALYEELCKTRGINPQDFMNALESQIKR